MLLFVSDNFVLKNSNHIWEGKYTLDILASSLDDNGVDFDIFLNGKRQNLHVKGRGVFQISVDIEKTGPVSLIVETKSDPVILSGLIMSPV